MNDSFKKWVILLFLGCIGIALPMEGQGITEVKSNSSIYQSDQSDEILKKSFTAKRTIKSLENVLQYIEHATGIAFVYRQELVKPYKNVSIKKDTKTIIGSLLDDIFENLPLSYVASENYIIITDSTATPVNKQEVITGIVREASSNEPLPGVNVILKGTTTGTFTNEAGEYTITASSPSDTLIFSFVGYTDREIAINGRSEINVSMSQKTSEMSELVVTSSYGTAQKRSDLVSSVYEVTAEDIAELPQQRIDKLLEGIVPGLQYNSQSDQPSSSRPRYSVTIRGEASLSASNEPLWIVDGTRLDTGGKTNMIRGMATSVSPLSYISPGDIESITVLKDASATSLYGADGANGVILVETKSGSKGDLRINASVRQGVSMIDESTRFKVLDGDQYMMLAKEAYQNAGRDMAYFPFTDNELNNYSDTNTDWYDTFYDKGLNSQVNLSASGGSDKISYYVSGSYYRDEQTVAGNEQQRISLRTKNELDLSDKVNLELSLGGSYNVNSLFTPNSEYYENLPIISPYSPDGSFRQHYEVIDGRTLTGEPNWEQQRFFNALAEREQNDNDQTAFALQGNFKFQYEPFDDIFYTAQIGTDYRGSNENIYQSMRNWSGYNLIDGEAVGIARWNNSKNLGWNMIHRANFDKTFDKHNISGVAGLEMVANKNTIVGAYGSGFLNDYLRAVSFASNTQGSGNEYINRKMSYFGQATYSYDERYNLTANVRQDGNSNFGKDVRWANFASVGAGWNIHNEDFFSSSIIDVLRIKGSYGSNGNSRIGTQEAQGVYSINDSDQYAGDPGAAMSQGPNPDLSWETTYMTNLGFRVAAFDSRVDLSVEVYRNKTENLLSRLDVSRTTGNTRVYRNVGAIENKGIEMILNTVNIQTNDFRWDTRILASKNKNQILELYNNIPKNFNRTRWEEGEDTNTYYLVRWAGVDPRDGAPLWYDASGNITRTFSTANRVAGKSSTPDLFGSVTNTFKYKNFSLQVLANYTIGGYAFSSFGRDVSSDGLNIMEGNQSINQLDRWQTPGDITETPRLLWGISTGSVRNSTRYLYKKTNVRIQKLSLTYQLAPELANSFGLKGMAVSLIGNNLALWTPYGDSNRNSYRNNMSGYPSVRDISLSVNVTF